MDPTNGVLLLDHTQLSVLPSKPQPMQPPGMDIPIWVIAKPSVELPEWVQRIDSIGQFVSMMDADTQIAVPDIADKDESAKGAQKKMEKFRDKRMKRQKAAFEENKRIDAEWKWPTDRKPRVFCYCCRFTSVMQHQAQGLLNGFKKAGCETMYFTEKSPIHRVHCGTAEAELSLPLIDAINEFKPDLIVNINWYRNKELHGVNRPVYTWVQDRVANLNRQSADSIGDRDFIGMLSSGLMSKWIAEGFPPNRIKLHPAGYDSDIFYPPADNQDREGIVYIEQNAAQTPYQAFRNMANNFPPLMPLLTEFYGRVSDIFSMGYDMFEPEYAKVWAQVEADFIKMHGAIPDMTPSVRNNMLYMFYHDVGNRWMRQRPLAELVAVGAPLKIYGRYWEDNPMLKPAAAGTISEYKDVADIYRKAKIVLNIQHECSMIHRTVEGLACGAHVLCKGLQADFEPAMKHVKTGWFGRPGEIVPACHDIMDMPNPMPEETGVLNYSYEVQAKWLLDWIDGEMREKK